MKTISNVECKQCEFKDKYQGCISTNDYSYTKECIVVECYKIGGEEYFQIYKNRLIDEFNALNISNMPLITTLCQLSAAYVNLEYTLASGQKVKLLDVKKYILAFN